tara:strand:+ start:1450 stop:1626 length:177 start_codon:yes stop_codon:yes gene_type:complete
VNADKNTVPDHDALGYASGIQLENGGAPAFIKKPARTKYENILSGLIRPKARVPVVFA